MTSRKRNNCESFKEYRNNLKDEARFTKERLSGTYFWISKQFDKAGRVAMTGTYRKDVK